MTTLLLLWYTILFVGILLCVKHFWTHRRFYVLSWSLNGPISLPIIGDGLRLFCKDEDILEVFTTKIIASYPSPCKIWFGPKLSVIFTEADQVEKVMSSMKFAYKDKVYRFMTPCFGEGLVGTSGPKWRSARRLIAPLFGTKTVNYCLPICTKQANILVDILKEKVNQPTFDIQKYLHRCVADLVAETIMEVKPGAQTGAMDDVIEAINRMYVLVHSRIMKPWLHNDFIFNALGYGKLEKEGCTVIHGFFKKCLEIAKENHKKKKANTSKNENTEVFQSILGEILDIRDENPDVITDEQLVHHLNTLFNASEDTFTRMCSFALVLFGMNPVIQNKVYDELREVFGTTQRPIQLEDLPKLTYLQMCIKDTIRLFPVAPLIMREASEDFAIDKWIIPKGCSVMVSIQNLHRSPKYWTNPNDFYPEHFLPTAVAARHNFAYLPFSAGPRGCIGKSFTYMAVPVILVSILRNYRVEADGTLEEKKLTADICVRFKGGYPIRLKHRD